MKKRYAYMAVVMVCLLLFSACASGVSAEPVKTAEPQPTHMPTVQQTEPAKTQQPETAAIPSEEPSAPLQIGEDIKVMLPVMDSVIRAMKEAGNDYTSADDAFLWTTMYLMTVNFGESLQMAEIKDNAVTAKRPMVEQMAAACFENFGDLPDVPEALSAAVSCRKDVYKFALSDIGDSSTEIVNIQPDGEATQVTVVFKSWDEAEEYVFTLVPYAGESAESIFLYTVRAAQKA